MLYGNAQSKTCIKKIMSLQVNSIVSIAQLWIVAKMQKQNEDNEIYSPAVVEIHYNLV